MTDSRPYITHAEVMREMIINDPDFAEAYLAECAQDDDPRIFLKAIKRVVETRPGGLAGVARTAGLSRPALHRALSGNSWPTMATLSRTLHALGFRLSVTREQPAIPLRRPASRKAGRVAGAGRQRTPA